MQVPCDQTQIMPPALYTTCIVHLVDFTALLQKSSAYHYLARSLCVMT